MQSTHVPRMWFGPDESCVDQPNFIKSLEFLQTYGQQFSGFKRGRDPCVGRLQIPLASLAKVEDALLGDAFRDVDTGPKARDAHVGWVGFDGRAAFAAGDATRHRRRNHAFHFIFFQNDSVF